MYHLAKDQSNKMARAGRLFHSDRPALKGGENCWMGKGYSERALPKAIVDTWMKSHAGHREWLLDPRVKTAAVAISSSRHGTFAAWAFSDQPLHQPIKMPFKVIVPRFKDNKAKGGVGMLRLPVKITLMCASVASIILGVHGLYAYFHPLETLFALGMEGYDKLFFTLELPVSGLQTIVGWMSLKGIQSWFIPAVFLIMGIVFWVLNQRIRGGSTILRKLHLW